MIDAKEYLKKMSAELDGPIKSYIGDEEPKNLMDSSKQYPYAGGKRMRPAMAVACCGAVGGDKSKAVPLAVAVEYIHNFTLIHDDLMDGDEVRRGMPTIHVGYGAPTAILAGDALFAKAFQIICDLDIPAERMRDALRYISQAVWDLARGQQMDVNNEGQLVTEDVYIETIKLKTSVLFAAAAAGGAIVGGADEKTVKAINEYAIELGLGFQMFDDYLGVAGTRRRPASPWATTYARGSAPVWSSMPCTTSRTPRSWRSSSPSSGTWKRPTSSAPAPRTSWRGRDPSSTASTWPDRKWTSPSPKSPSSPRPRRRSSCSPWPTTPSTGKSENHQTPGSISGPGTFSFYCDQF